MKHLYSLTIGLLSAAVAIPAAARVTGISVPGPYPHTPSQSSASSALIVNTRLLAKSYYLYQNGQFAPVDSFHYGYTSNRGGSPEEMDLNDDGVMFDESVRYIYNGSAFINKMKRVQLYGVNDRVEWLYYRPWNNGIQDWKDSIRYAYLYDGQSSKILHARLDIASFLNPSQPWANGNNYLYNNSYSNSGYILSINATTQIIDFSYDNNDNLICREISESNTITTWHQTIKDSFLYDASGRLNYVLHQTYNMATSSWVNNTRTYYTYVTAMSNNLDYSLVEKWNTATSAWEKKEKHLYSYDAADNKIADVTQNWNAGQSAYVNASRIDWTYNYNHQITSITTKTWNNATTAWAPISGDYQRFFYYESYFPTSIKHLDDAVVNMNMFPVPAKDALYFSIDWRTPQAFSMSVTDMQGRTMQQWSEHAAINYERKLDVSQWPAGNYLLTVAGTNGQATKRFVVAR